MNHRSFGAIPRLFAFSFCSSPSLKTSTLCPDFAPLLDQMERPDAQQDASEFLGELWGQANVQNNTQGLQGVWASLIGNRLRYHDTVPIFVSMGQEAPQGISIEALLSQWVNEERGQRLSEHVEHVAFWWATSGAPGTAISMSKFALRAVVAHLGEDRGPLHLYW